MIIGPHLLKKTVKNRKTDVFLCGPGYGGENFSVREYIRTSLTEIDNVSVHYGEEIEKISSFRRAKKDLQTLEAEFAHTVDFTLLMLESPGSMAELGTFSMIPNICSRLVVLVPKNSTKAIAIFLEDR